MYADDTSYIVTDNGPHTLHSKLSRELDNPSNWIKASKFKLNINKTHVRLLKNRSLMYELAPIRLGEAVGQHVNTTNFLGVLLDDNLKWTHHISNLCNSLSKTAGILYHV